MTREEAARLLNEIMPNEEDQWTAEELHDLAALGFNELGGGFLNRGVFFFKYAEDAESFIADAPVTRSLVWLDE
jgi:hypothetical protein